MNKLSDNILTKKDFSLVLLIFILPFLSYLHLAFIESAHLLELFRTIDIFNLYEAKNEDIIAIIYSILTWFAYLALLLICYNSLKNRRLRPFYLFPMYLATRKLILYIFYFLHVFENFDAIVTLTLAGIFIIHFLVKNKQLKAISFFSLPALILISIPFFNELWKLYPEGIEKLRFLFFEIDANGFPDANSALYHYLEKTSFILPCLIYLYYQKHWMKYAFFAPIIIYSSQLYNLVFFDYSFADEIEVYQTAKFTIPLIGILLLLSKASDHQKRIKHWIESQYAEIESMQKKKFLKRQKLINSKRRDIVGANTEVLQKIKTELEQELKNSN